MKPFSSMADIRTAMPDDAAALARIYNHYITETVITFEQEPVGPTEMQRRVDAVQAASLPWLVAEQDSQLKGYAYATRWRERFAYRFSVEITVYLDAAHSGQGLGSQLYSRLFELLRQADMHTVIAGIALPNPASVALHEKFGMQKVAHFAEVGYKFGQWIDVGYWQRTLV